LKYICSWSGGKDSTASIILAHLNGEPLDTIIFAEVMFDKYTSGENPYHIDFVMKVAKPLFESWGYEVVIVRSERTYLDCFNRVIEHPIKHMEHKGMKHGFPLTGACSIKRDLKIRPIEEYYRSLGDEYVQYVGIGVDEPGRLAAMHKDSYKVSLLEKYGYTTEMAKELCEMYGLLSPNYSLSKRGGCWMCPFAKLEEHRKIRELCPDAWATFVALEDARNVAYDKWSIYGETLKEREEQFRQEELSKNEELLSRVA